MVERCQEMMPRRAFNTKVGDGFVYNEVNDAKFFAENNWWRYERWVLNSGSNVFDCFTSFLWVTHPLVTFLISKRDF